MADSNVVDFLMKNKKSDGSFEILHPISKAANIKTHEAIEVMLTEDIGSYSNGDIISADTSVDTILRKILQKQIPPVYTAPSAAISVTDATAGSYEVGTKLTPNLTASFTKNDAGDLTKLAITKNGTEVKSGDSSPLSHSEEITVDGTITFKAVATYGAGAVKKDNFGEDYPTGAIAEGSKESSAISYTGYRQYFSGTDDKTVAATTSDEIRALTGGKKNAAAGNTFTVKVTKGQRRATFAYPATLRDVSSVKYVEFNNDESKTFFNKTTVSVEGAGGYTAIDYKVYTYIPDQAFPSDMTFSVTI